MDWHYEFPLWPAEALRSPTIAAQLTVYACPWCGMYLKGDDGKQLLQGHMATIHPHKQAQVLVYPPAVSVAGAGYDG